MRYVLTLGVLAAFLAGCVPTGGVQLSSRPQGAAVYIDGDSTGDRTDCIIADLPAGPHVFRLTRYGYYDWQQELEVVAGHTILVEVALAGAPGAIEVSSLPESAEVWLDDSATGCWTNCILKNVPAGRHQLRLVRESYLDWVTEVEVEPTATVRVGAALLSMNGSLRVCSEPPGAQVWLAGVPTGMVTDCFLTGLREDTYALALIMPGYETWDTLITVAARAVCEVSARLRAAPLAPGTVRVSSDPTGAAIWLDGAPTGRTTDCTLAAIPAGSHVLTLTHRDCLDWTRTVVVTPSQTTDVRAALIRTGTLAVSSYPTGAAVWLDGVDTGRKTDCRLEKLAPGSYTLTLVHPVYHEWSQVVTVTAGSTATVEAILVARAGTLQVNSVPTGAAIWINGTRSIHATDHQFERVPVSYVHVRLGHAGYPDWSTIVSVAEDQTRTINADLAGPGRGIVRVRSVPSGARVVLDGQDLGRVTECVLEDVLPGEHDLLLTCAGYHPWRDRIAVRAGEWTTVSAVLEPQSGLLREVSHLDLPGSAWSVTVAGHYAYVGLRDCPADFRVIDIANPFRPVEVGQCATGLTVWSLWLRDNLVYAAGTGGVVAVSVADPSRPARVGRGQGSSELSACCGLGTWLYGADPCGGLWTYSLADPTSPVALGRCDLLPRSLGVCARDAVVYVCGEGAGLQLLDVSQPGQPAIAGRCEMPGAAQDVMLDGPYAYVAAASAGLRVVDVQDRYQPIEVGSFSSVDYAWDVWVGDGQACIADDRAGLRLLDVSDPTLPSEIGVCDTPGRARAVAVQDGFAYVADETGGLRVIELVP